MPEIREPGFEAALQTDDYIETGYHRNNEGLISITRHGDKTPEGELSEKGFAQARQKGQAREVVGPGVKGYHSPEKRTKQTADTIVETIPGQIDAEEITKYASRARDQLHFKPVSKEFLAEWAKQGKNQLEWYVNQDKPFDAGTITAQQMADRAANFIYRQARMIGRLKDGSRVNLEDASHTPTLDVFVLKAMKDEIERNPVNPEGKTLIEKMGGGFETADEFSIRAQTDQSGRLSANMVFRGKEWPLSLKRLREMSEEYLKSKE